MTVRGPFVTLSLVRSPVRVELRLRPAERRQGVTGLPDSARPARKNVDVDVGREALLGQRGLSTLRAPPLAHRVVEHVDDEGDAMSSQRGRIRARRAPRLGRVTGRSQRSPLQRARREALARRLRALVETPEGAVRLLEEYARVAPAAAAQFVSEWRAWLRHANPALAEQLAAREVAGG